MSQIYCRKIDGFEFVVYPHYHNHVVVIKTAKSIVCKPLFSMEAFDAPFFEVNVRNAHFRHKNHQYRVSNAEELTVIPSWFNGWYQAGCNVKLTMNQQEKFAFDGMNAKREAYLTSIGFYG